MIEAHPGNDNSGKVKRLTALFIAAEAVLLYYWVGLMQSSFKFLPGIYYILQTHFSVFLIFFDYFASGYNGPLPHHLLEIYQFYGGLNFVTAIAMHSQPLYHWLLTSTGWL